MSDTDTIDWSSDFFVSWSDFKAEHNPSIFEDSHSVIKYRFTWTVNSEKINGSIFFFVEDIQLFTEFHPLLSSVRTSEASDKLLKHEQGNFDLAELVNRKNLKKLQNTFYEKPFPTRGQNEEQRKQFAEIDSGKMIASEIEKLESLFRQRSRDYHEQTDYGNDAKKQLDYNLTFDNLRS